MGKEQNIKKHQGQVIPFIQDGEYFFNKGLKAYHQQDLRRAEKYLQRAVRFEPEEPVFAVQYAVILSERGNYDESNRMLTRVLDELDPEMAECRYFLANNFAHLGLFQEAEKNAKLYIKAAPNGEFADDIVELLDLLGIENDEIGNGDFEIEDDLLLKQEQARSYLEKGDFDKAIKSLEDIITDYPELWSNYNNLALAYFYSGETDNALDVLGDVLEKDPGNLHALCNLAVFSHYLGVENKVQDVIGQLMSVYPISADHRFKLGATFALTGYHDQAYRWLRWLDKHGYEGDGSFYYWLALSAHRTGNQGVAERAWKSVTEHNPQKAGKEPWKKHEETRESQANNFHGFTFEDLKEHQTFRNMLAEALGSGETFETKLYALYILKRVEDDRAYRVLRDFAEDGSQPFVLKEFAAHMMLQMKPEKTVSIVHNDAEKRIKKVKTRAVVQLADTAELICRNNMQQLAMPALHELLVSWSQLAAEMLNMKKSRHTNAEAMAAALEYVWKLDKEQKLTQNAAAQKYGISPGTVSKYVKLVNTLLS